MQPQVQKRAVGIANWINSNPTVTDAEGNERTLRELKLSSPEFSNAVNDYVYGGEVLTPREAQAAAGLCKAVCRAVNAITQPPGVQERTADGV